MIIKTFVQAVFFIQVIRISAIDRDETQETARMIMNTLKNLDFDKSNDKNSQNPTNMLKEPQDGRNIQYSTHIEDMKPKRSWEDVSLIWRTSPKRAWEVVNTLWKNPVIRRKYQTFLENGKRSDEIMENIPVQQNNENPFWMIDEIGYDVNLGNPTVRNSALGSEPWSGGSFKRGWEAVNPVWKKIVSSKHARNVDMIKRGWDEVFWKRNSEGHSKHSFVVPNNEVSDNTGVFDAYVIKALEDATKLNQKTKLRLSADSVLPDYPFSWSGNIFNKIMKSSTSTLDNNDNFSSNIGFGSNTHNLKGVPDYNGVPDDTDKLGLV